MGVDPQRGDQLSTLIKWFPDKRGMATGMAIMGFGGGAMGLMKLMSGAQATGAVIPSALDNGSQNTEKP